MIRAFVALPVPEALVPLLLAAQRDLPVGNPVPEENFHLTLAFLGEQPEPVVEEVHHALDGLRAAPVPMAIHGVGQFGETEPRVLYAAVPGDPALSHLRRKVLSAVRGVGIDLPRTRFVPHVTLARFARGMAPEDRLRLAEFVATRMGMAAAAERITEFTLYESRLGRSGPHYEPLATYPLAA